ncbi:MAG: hypothetical protein J6Y94_01160 [Bacteriovoracaceae bacterium]|nr:hypothetical protein [Bacteriovoracaceae bacterium]
MKTARPINYLASPLNYLLAFMVWAMARSMVFSLLISSLSPVAQAEAPFSNKAAIAGISYIHDRNEEAGQHDEIPATEDIKYNSARVNQMLNNPATLYKALAKASPEEREKFFQKYPAKKPIYEKYKREVVHKTEANPALPATQLGKTNVTSKSNAASRHSFMRQVRHVRTTQQQERSPSTANVDFNQNHSQHDQQLLNPSRTEKVGALAENIKNACDGLNEACTMAKENLPSTQKITQDLKNLNQRLQKFNEKLAAKNKKNDADSSADHPQANTPGQDNSERAAHPKLKKQYNFAEIPMAELDSTALNPGEDDSERADSPKGQLQETISPRQHGKGIRQ